MENDTLLKGVTIPEQGFIEVQITSAGEVVQTGKSVRYDGVDCYQPVGPELIGSATPAVDAVEVVRCGKCEFRYYAPDGSGHCRKKLGDWFTDDGFCSDGLPKEGDGDGDV